MGVTMITIKKTTYKDLGDLKQKFVTSYLLNTFMQRLSKDINYTIPFMAITL